MGDIVDIDKYKSSKLAKAEADFQRYMIQAEQFTAEGKNEFAKKMVEKAKEARAIIDKLRKPVRRPASTPAVPPFSVPHQNVKISYEFQSSADLGYPKVTPTPSITPENN